MRTSDSFLFGMIELEYHDEILTALRCRPLRREITPEERKGRSAFSDAVLRQVKEYMAGERREFELRYELQGTAFQKRVWQALLTIPYGETRSYREVAEMIGSPAAVRAVGMANHRNPLNLIIPCHRVIGADGSLTGYAGGLEMKRFLLELEAGKRRNFL